MLTVEPYVLFNEGLSEDFMIGRCLRKGNSLSPILVPYREEEDLNVILNTSIRVDVFTCYNVGT